MIGRVSETGSGLSSWPRLREVWWVVALVAVALVLFTVGLLVRVRCGLELCDGSVRDRVFDLDSVGGLPRLFTTGVFAGAAVLAGVAATRTSGLVRLWWSVVAAGGLLLSLAKLVSAHSALEDSDGGVRTLLVGLAVTLAAMALLGLAGRAWGVVGTGAVVLALSAYAAAALGLDAATTLVAAAQRSVGAFSAAAATFIEEFGEAVAALVVLVTVRWHVPPPGSVAGVGAGARAGAGAAAGAGRPVDPDPPPHRLA